MKRSRLIFAFLAAVLLVGSDLAAQGPPGPPPPGAPGQPMRQRVRERIKTVKVWKLTEELHLTPQQSERFFPLYNEFSNQREEIDRQRLELLDRLDSLTRQESPPREEIDRLLDRLEGLEKEMQTARAKFRSDLKGMLSPRQVGRLFVFEARFLQQMQEIMHDVRRQMRERGSLRSPED